MSGRGFQTIAGLFAIAILSLLRVMNVVDAATPDLLFDGATLIAKVEPRRLLQNPRTGNGVLAYSLYELVPADRARNGIAAILRVDGAKGLHSERGVGNPLITVAPRPMARGSLREGVVRLELPATANYATACYVLSDIGSYVVARPDGGNTDQKFAFSLRAADRAFAVGRRLAAARSESSAADAVLVALEQRINEARRNLPGHRAFQVGRCEMPPQAPLPAQPRNTLPLAEARELAEAVVLDVMSRRMGCDLMAEFANRTGFASDWRRFVSRFTCGRTELPKLYTTDELTPFVDYLESRLLSCAAKDADCLLPAAALLLARYHVNVEEITQRLNAPYMQWQSQVAAITAEAPRLFAECRSMESLMLSAGSLTAEAQGAVARTGAALASAKAGADEFAKKGVSKDDWACRVPFKTFNPKGLPDLTFVN